MLDSEFDHNAGMISKADDENPDVLVRERAKFIEHRSGGAVLGTSDGSRLSHAVIRYANQSKRDMKPDLEVAWLDQDPTINPRSMVSEQCGR